MTSPRESMYRSKFPWTSSRSANECDCVSQGSIYGDVPSAAICYVWDNRASPGPTREPRTEARAPRRVAQWGEERGTLGGRAARCRGGFPRRLRARRRRRVTGIAAGNDTDQTAETVDRMVRRLPDRSALKRLVLAGGGHAHIEVLRDLAARVPGSGIAVTVVSPRPRPRLHGHDSRRHRGALSPGGLRHRRRGARAARQRALRERQSFASTPQTIACTAPTARRSTTTSCRSMWARTWPWVRRPASTSTQRSFVPWRC